MNKKELIKNVATKLDITQKDTEAVVSEVFNTIADALVDGKEVSITGFGKFSVSERAARTGVNPSTGEKLQIAASKAAKFKASKILKEALK